MTTLANYMRNVLSKSVYSRIVFLLHPLSCIELNINIVDLTTVITINTIYVYILLSAGMNVSKAERNIVMSSDRTTKT